MADLGFVNGGWLISDETQSAKEEHGGGSGGPPPELFFENSLNLVHFDAT